MKFNKKVVVIIPSRYKSTRFPGKPLVDILGKPMVVRVADLSSKAVGKENVFVGLGSGGNSTTGCRNIALGSNTLGGAITTGNNNIA